MISEVPVTHDDRRYPGRVEMLMENKKQRKVGFRKKLRQITPKDISPGAYFLQRGPAPTLHYHHTVSPSGYQKSTH